MRRIVAAAAVAVGLTAGTVAGSPSPANAHVPSPVSAVCTWVLEGSDYGPTFNYDSTDSIMVHYGGYHIYNCAARYVFGSSSTRSLCYQENWETHATHFWGTRPRGQCS